jgi:hypothetical protein
MSKLTAPSTMRVYQFRHATKIWYLRWDSNPQVLRHGVLNAARKPVSPLRHELEAPVRFELTCYSVTLSTGSKPEVIRGQVWYWV